MPFRERRRGRAHGGGGGAPRGPARAATLALAAVLAGAFALAVGLAAWPGPAPDGPPPAAGASPAAGPPPPLRPGVLVVHTHREERYDPTACRAADRLAPGPGDVIEAARLLAADLRAQGVPAWHDDRFGSDSAPGAYARVRPRLLALVRAFPGAGLVLDLHRDDLDHARATAIARGRPTARLLWVVGSRPRTPGFDWRANLALAADFADWLRAHAPALDRGIWVKPGDYGQDLGPPSVLLEVGGRGSCPGEVARALTVVARLLAEVLPAEVSR